MTDKEEIQLKYEISRAQKAKEILENEVYIEAMQALEDKLIKAWRTSPLRDIEGQHELRLSISIVDAIKSYFNQTFETGKIAQKQLDTLTHKKKSLFNF